MKGSRKMLLTFECPQDILINRSRPVHEATGGHAVRGNYCIHNHIWDNFADNSNIFAMPVEFFSGNHADFL